ncbi:MAG: cytochrome ubiquinol oxidase subunit I, partial [Nocardioides sp.]
MTTTSARGQAAETRAPLIAWGRSIVRVLTTTDHKVIGKLYLTTSFSWFLIGGLMAMLIRSELAFP